MPTRRVRVTQRGCGHSLNAYPPSPSPCLAPFCQHSRAHGIQDALNVLNTLQSNATLVAQWQKERRVDLTATLEKEMQALCDRVGIDLNVLGSRAIHVAGTKGKGSTCAMAESIVRAHGHTTGLYTSPHLVSVRERIKLNGQPLTETQFAEYFFRVHAALTREPALPLPSYFRFLTVMAFAVFAWERVDCAVVEVGIGGRTDSTNVLPTARAVGLTTLDYDHCNVLGNTLAEIAFEKAGILKHNVPAVFAPQTREAAAVFRQRAAAVKAHLFRARPWDDYARGDARLLALAGSFQAINASVAVALAQVWLGNLRIQPPKGDEEAPLFPLVPLSEAMRIGLQRTHWPGRAHRIDGAPASNIRLFLDGAHTPASIAASAEWWHAQDEVAAADRRVLVFTCKTGKPTPDLLRPLVASAQAQPYHAVYFTAAQVRLPRDPSNAITNVLNGDTSSQEAMATLWRSLGGVGAVRVLSTIDAAMDALCSEARDTDTVCVHVTGSLYLVGGFLDVLGHQI